MSDPDFLGDAAVTIPKPGMTVPTPLAKHASDGITPTAVADATEDSAFVWLRRSDQVVVATLLVALILLTTLHWLQLSRWGSAAIEVQSREPREYYYSLDINTASWVEWAQLEGIGEKLAKRIIADRNEFGAFRNADDVRRVPGIHRKQLQSMRPFLRGGIESAGVVR